MSLTAGQPSKEGPRLYFIRHGETERSLSHRHTGKTDIPLTAHGEEQARALGIRLRDVDFSSVLTSPRQRARRTCELARLTRPAEIEPDLVEWDYGEYDGLTSEEIRKSRPGWNVFSDGCPGGESPLEVSDRADRLIVRLDLLRGNLALFSHGQFGSVLAARWIGLPVGTGQHFSLLPGSLSILGHNPGHSEIRAISLWNDADVAIGCRG